MHSGGGGLDNHKPPVSNGFTLAEVLITIGIIGVVAAMTLPTVITNIKYAQIKASLKKNYALTLQVLDQINKDQGFNITGDYRIFNNRAVNVFKEYYKLPDPKCKNQKLCNRYDFKTFDGRDFHSDSYLDDGLFYTNDGSQYIFNNDGYGLFITIDVNSKAKGPNRWGYDMFTFEITKQGKLLPMGAQTTKYTDLDKYCSISSTEARNGIACTYKALTEKDYFKNLPK